MCNFHHFLFDSDVDWMVIDNSMMKIDKLGRRRGLPPNDIKQSFIRHFMLAMMYVRTRELTMRRTMKCFVSHCVMGMHI